MKRFKVHVNGGQHQFVEASNPYAAARKVTDATGLKKVEPKRNPPAGYTITTYENDDTTIEVIEG